VNRTLSGVFWVVLYLFVVLLPLFLMMARLTPPERPFWTEFSLGLGFVGVVQISIQFALIARYKNLTAPYGIDLILKYHRQIAMMAVLFLVAHPIILVVQNPSLLYLLNPIGGTTASRAGNWALYSLVLLTLLSVFRKRLKLGYEAWRVTHALLGVTAVVLAHVHINLAGYYTDTLWKEVVLVAVSAVFMSSFLYLRFIKPAFQKRKAYTVAAIKPERGGTYALALEPKGHAGMRFRPGQFAWLKLGKNAYTIEEHPFSFSSSATQPERLEFGIKELGDFTSQVKNVPLGTTAYLDGPHGAFSIDLDPAPGYVFLAGGVGITPFMSTLKTMAARGDKRPVLMFYGARTWEETAFRDELEGLKNELDLELVYVLEKPGDSWQGEKGFITAEVLKRHLPKEGIERLYLMCGPPVMMDAVTKALTEVGVPLEYVRSERFNLV
jgi:predicted ferric reductase